LTWRNLGAEVACGLVVIVSFCLDWRSASAEGGPASFAWWLFLPALLAGTGVFAREAAMSLRVKRGAGAASAESG
jgi:hypothetical protein